MLSIFQKYRYIDVDIDVSPSTGATIMYPSCERVYFSTISSATRAAATSVSRVKVLLFAHSVSLANKITLFLLNDSRAMYGMCIPEWK